MSKAKLAYGTRIYYTGDQANQPNYGTVIDYYPSCRLGSASYDVKFDEDRYDGDPDRIGNVCATSFLPGPGCRFWLADEWEAHQKERAQESQREIERAVQAMQNRLP